MSYRPITDLWICARPKVKYHGAYPVGFPERARALMPCTREVPVLHACGGRAKEYRWPDGKPAWNKVCPNDVTCDLDAAVNPDLVWNVRTDGIPSPSKFPGVLYTDWGSPTYWSGIIVDPPYTGVDAEQYAPGRDELPDPKRILVSAMDVLHPGGRVGILHYVWPRHPKVGVKSVACIGVIVGFDNRIRVFSVFEKR